MKRIKENLLSSIIGLLFIVAGFVFLFVETLQEIPLYVVIGLWVGGVLLLFAKDKLLDILTVGVSRFLKDVSTIKK